MAPHRLAKLVLCISTCDMGHVRGAGRDHTRVTFPHEVEVSDVMEVTCSLAQFVHASRAAHALTKRMSNCDKLSDDWGTGAAFLPGSMLGPRCVRDVHII